VCRAANTCFATMFSNSGFDQVASSDQTAICNTTDDFHCGARMLLDIFG
jgi:hypothetical protein